MSGNGQGSIAKGFVSATLLFVIGAMAIVGALDSGLRGDHSVLYTKSILDGFASVILTTTLASASSSPPCRSLFMRGASRCWRRKSNGLCRRKCSIRSSPNQRRPEVF
ncbi:putative membrane protein YdfK [Geobacillus sp. BCO2]|nr:putative membrane protein YdfK [Geobacillus sp. BCO2]